MIIINNDYFFELQVFGKEERKKLLEIKDIDLKRQLI